MAAVRIAADGGGLRQETRAVGVAADALGDSVADGTGHRVVCEIV